jgi:hypothetical protein
MLREKKLIARGCAEIQRKRGKAAIVLTRQAVLTPVSVPADRIHAYSPVAKVSVPVILESREETICVHYFTDKEIVRICGME